MYLDEYNLGPNCFFRLMYYANSRKAIPMRFTVPDVTNVVFHAYGIMAILKKLTIQKSSWSGFQHNLVLQGFP